jgi:hypothetical protein
VVFFTGLLAFATAFLHNINTSSGALSNDTQVDTNSTDAAATNSTGDEVFPRDFLKAFASTFIFLVMFPRVSPNRQGVRLLSR